MNPNNQLLLIDACQKLSVGTRVILKTDIPITVNYIIGEPSCLPEEQEIAKKLFWESTDGDNVLYMLTETNGDGTSLRESEAILEVVEMDVVNRKAVRIAVNNNLVITTTSSDLLGSLTGALAKILTNMRESYEPLYHNLPGNLNIRHLTQCELYVSKWVDLERMTTRDASVEFGSGFKIHTTAEAFISANKRVVQIAHSNAFNYIYMTIDGKYIQYANEPLPSEVVFGNFGDECISIEMLDVTYYIFGLNKTNILS